MKQQTVNGVSLHYTVDGPAGAPWLVLSNSLGTDLSMWQPQLAAFAARFQVLRYDTRGHGASAAPPGPYTIEQLSGDVIGLLDALSIERAHFCGLSMGGLTGVALGARHPTRIARLVLCNTAARVGSVEMWQARIDRVREVGMAALADGVLERWFQPAWRAREGATLAQVRTVLAGTSAAGYSANCEALRDTDLRPEAASITAPTLVISGTHDLAATPEQGHWLQQTIPDARYLELDASHLSNLEQPAAFNCAVLDFLGDTA